MIISLVRLTENLIDYFFLRNFIRIHLSDVDNLSVLYFEFLRMSCVLSKMPHNYAVQIIKGMYMYHILKLERMLSNLDSEETELSELVERTEPLTDPEKFDFVPKDLDDTADTPSLCEELTTDNFEESLRTYFRSLYQASFGIKNLLNMTDSQFKRALPVLKHRVKK